MNEQIFIASPLSVFERLLELMRTRDFYDSVLRTMGLICLGFALAAVLGSALGWLGCKSRAAKTLLSPIMGVIKATPVASFIILAFILVGSRRLSALIAFLMVLPVFYSNVLTALESLPARRFEAADVFGMLPRDRFRFIYLPGLAPYFLSASGIGLGMAWKSGVAAEVIGLAAGSIGRRLYEAKLNLDTAGLFAYTLVVVLLSLALEKLLRLLLERLESRLLKS